MGKENLVFEQPACGFADIIDGQRIPVTGFLPGSLDVIRPPFFVGEMDEKDVGHAGGSERLPEFFLHPGRGYGNQNQVGLHSSQPLDFGWDVKAQRLLQRLASRTPRPMEAVRIDAANNLAARVFKLADAPVLQRGVPLFHAGDDLVAPGLEFERRVGPQLLTPAPRAGFHF